MAYPAVGKSAGRKARHASFKDIPPQDVTWVTAVLELNGLTMFLTRDDGKRPGEMTIIPSM